MNPQQGVYLAIVVALITVVIIAVTVLYNRESIEVKQQPPATHIALIDPPTEPINVAIMEKKTPSSIRKFSAGGKEDIPEHEQELVRSAMGISGAMPPISAKAGAFTWQD